MHGSKLLKKVYWWLVLGQVLFSALLVKGADLLKECAKDSECPAHASCQSRWCYGKICLCEDAFTPSHDERSCVKGMDLGETCGSDSRCRVPQSECLNGTCKCHDGHSVANASVIGLLVCIPNPLENVKAVVLGQKCDSRTDVRCVGDYVDCIAGVCQCETGYRSTTVEEMRLFPFVLHQCIPESFKHDMTVNVTEECSKFGIPAGQPYTYKSSSSPSSTPTFSTSTPSTISISSSTTATTTKPSSSTSTKSVSIPTSSTTSLVTTSTISPTSTSSTTTVTTSSSSPSTTTKSSTTKTTTSSTTTSTTTRPSSSTTKATTSTTTRPSSSTTTKTTTSTTTRPSFSTTTKSSTTSTTVSTTTFKTQSSTASSIVSLESTMTEASTTKSQVPPSSTTVSTTINKTSTTSAAVSTSTGSSTSAASIKFVTTESSRPVASSVNVLSSKTINQETTTVHVGNKCGTCPDNSDCEPDTCNVYRCRCKLGYAYSPDRTECWKLSTLGEDCTERKICQGPFTVCDGVCKCEDEYERSDNGRWCRLKNSWFIDFPLLGEPCSGGFQSDCYMEYEQTCTDNICKCKEGLRGVDDGNDDDRKAIYPGISQCRNSSLPIGYRPRDICEGQSKETFSTDIYDRAKSKVRRMQGAIIGGSIGGVALIGILVGTVALVRWKRRERRGAMRDTSSTASTEGQRYSFKIPRPFMNYESQKEYDSNQISYPNIALETDTPTTHYNTPQTIHESSLDRQDIGT